MAVTGVAAAGYTPAAMKQTLATAYIDFAAAGSSDGWAQQYLPDLMEKEAEVFGNRTISGFLSQVGAEESMSADQVIWSEQGRLHLSYKAHAFATGKVRLTFDIDEAVGATTGILAVHGVRLNDTVIVSNSNGIVKCIVTSIDNDDELTLATYDGSTFAALAGEKLTTVLVYGSEFAKGTGYNAANSTLIDNRGANQPQFKTFSNKPIILKDYFEVSGSDTARIGWVETTAEDGSGGYMWYLKAEADTRARFNDYLEMSMLEGEIVSDSDANYGAGISATANGVDAHLGLNGGVVGTEGLFAAIEDRGNLTSGITGVNAATDLAEFDAILAEFDKQGAIEENMMFVNRATSLAMDDMLASMNSYGAGGTSYGVFDNSEDMALNLGFSGFRRGSYDFYKSDFKYLNDKSTRGAINSTDSTNAIHGVMIPAGVSSVYDQNLGRNLKRPFLHVRYRASNMESRKYKTWTTGSVGATTSDIDAMEMHFLSERCLVVQGANNFVLLKG